MQLSCTADGCAIKTKKTTIHVNQQMTIGDFVLPGPGEYETQSVFAEVLPDITVFHADELRLAYLGHAKRTLDESEKEALEEIDVLLVAADSSAKDELKQITELTNEIEPKVLVLTGVGDPAAFAKIEGQTPTLVDTLKLTPADLPQEDRQVYILKG